ncbi:MAG: hypothetical protein ACHQRL_00655 [Gemmatimonadales bacterium]
MPAIEIRPRRATELVDAGFQLLRRYYPQLFTLAAIAMAPSVILRVLMRDSLSDPTVMVSHPGPAIFISLLAIVCSTIADAVLIVMASDGYLDGAVDPSRSLGKGMSRLGYVFIASIFRWFIIGSLAVALTVSVPLLTAVHLQVLLIVIVPVAFWALFYVMLRTFAVSQAVLLEDSGPLEAFGRSLRLSESCGAHVFFTLALVWLLYLIAYFVTLGVATALVTRTIAEIVAGVITVAIYPLVAVVSTLLYYDLRVRKEGFDLEVMSRELGGDARADGGAPLPAA